MVGGACSRGFMSGWSRTFRGHSCKLFFSFRGPVRHKLFVLWTWCAGTFMLSLSNGVEGSWWSRLARVRRLGLAPAVLKTAVCKRAVGMGLSEDWVELAGGRGCLSWKQPRCVLLGGNLCVCIPNEGEWCQGSWRANVFRRLLLIIFSDFSFP